MTDAAGFGPWAKGDVFVGSTVLDDSQDDHAGRGRILQYDAKLNLKGSLWIEHTRHLVGGLDFDRQGRLWAFDSQDFVVLNVYPDGRVERRDFGKRAYSHASFPRDGSVLLAEHVSGSLIKPEIAARMGTRIPLMPGTDRMGDGHVWRFSAAGKLLKEYATHTHGGIGGFLGVTMSALSPDESTLVYCSETGPRLMRYDLAGDRQLPDLQSFPEGQREMFFGMEYGAGGKLYVLRGSRLHVVDAKGITARSYPLQGFGWATLELAADGRHAYVGNFFTGELAKLDLVSGDEVASVQTGMPKSLAGIAEFAGAPRTGGATAKRATNKRATKQRTAKKRTTGKRAVKKRSAAGRRAAARRRPRSARRRR